MPMHRHQRFDSGPLSVAAVDYTGMLRGVFRQAVGYALASALAASGCAVSREPAQTETGLADGKGADSQATPPTINGPQRRQSDFAKPKSPTVSPVAVAKPMAGAAAPAPDGDVGASAGADAPRERTSRPTPVDLECQNGFIPQLFAGLTAQPFDAAGFLIQSAGTSTPQLLFAQGGWCATATDLAACQADVAVATDKANLPLADYYPMYGMSTRYVVTTRGNEVRKYQSRAELLQFLGPIDSAEDALLLLYYDNHPVLCESSAPTSTFTGIDASSVLELDDGFQVVSLAYTGGCAGVKRERVTLHVASDGTVTEIAREIMADQMAGCVGRRPEGLSSRHVGSSASELGEYLARMAHLEHASIAAFEVLAAELAHHRAPAELIAAARSAAADEVRHTATTRELARRFGVSPTTAEVAPRPLRSLEALALDNATEGCVRECFGAALGCYQAQCAGDAAIAAAMAVIAEDETRHAALAFAIDAWVQSRLDDRSRARVAAARAHAVSALRSELAVDCDASTRAALGLPDAVAALRLCNALEQSLWAA
jgi:hypothetical protein